jgi:hypothetical protein
MSSPTKVTYTMASSSGPTSSKIEVKRLERTMRKVWFKMIHKKIQQNQAEAEANSGITNTRGVISETILKFETSLPWLTRIAYNYYYRQATVTPERVVTIDYASSSQLSGCPAAKEKDCNTTTCRRPPPAPLVCVFALKATMSMEMLCKL